MVQEVPQSVQSVKIDQRQKLVMGMELELNILEPAHQSKQNVFGIRQWSKYNVFESEQWNKHSVLKSM